MKIWMIITLTIALGLITIASLMVLLVMAHDFFMEEYEKKRIGELRRKSHHLDSSNGESLYNRDVLLLDLERYHDRKVTC